ncbi:low molecular weight protein-tyrosine-phosphatase [Actinoallomurus rhizosphaericola]|uniref:low molecular weight protein-tyrosine-phosphatase n=1 Tax=Actinoallomurus rhizosphaericola TaxID=2952536 RepID=UPI0020928D8B|nr:low molecular weight protein-tyrosine-phosphatase [Actinoallomurus rhizosphaericola]MCO5995789.1 low molecular weight phosphotyrosine protein phosphatase [Actinoallomurus rhizosphaericola]
MPYRVTFVCTGNICRSPMAEHIFRRHVEEEGLDVEVDSSGTGHWHVGDPADERAVATLRRAGYTSAHRARQFEAAWFDRYDLIIALDQGHQSDLRYLAPDEEAADKIRLLREFDPDARHLDVADPYYSRNSAFEEVREQIEAAVPGLLDHVRGRLKDAS